eukprot:TRINITY_DN1006_c0_g1_i3.p1 TRINITY_DN1006_c0_g1~~TRINITY_DN1006_c0_g1_i3.p1  ORF type:complete len:245 (+),score=60.97 TRINITY_DN1006_c0_g1_i3:145-879(+)
MLRSLVGSEMCIRDRNYPFHNVLNPIIAALFAGNSIVIKASEYASWSTKFYLEMIHRCCDAAGAPRDLVQIVTGYGAAGNALVSGGVDIVIFVGSVEVGKKVMASASHSLTPVILELGGKDVFVICDDANPAKLAQLACRGVYQNMGQNCAGPERFLVYERVYDEFCKAVTEVVLSMNQAPPLDQKVVTLADLTMTLADLLTMTRSSSTVAHAVCHSPCPGIKSLWTTPSPKARSCWLAAPSRT